MRNIDCGKWQWKGASEHHNEESQGAMVSTAARQSEHHEATTVTPFRIWATAGITEHMGGIGATERLLDRCRVAPGQRVLDLGCGTGYTAALLARRYQARVTALDINRELVAAARRRALRAGVSDYVDTLQANAHAVPALGNSFDVVIVESVLVFCETPHVLAEIWRVLRPGGVIGINELTLRQSPPEPLHILLQDILHMHLGAEQEWREYLEQAGFVNITASVNALRIRDQLIGHVVIDGLRAYLASIVRGVADPAIRRVFCTRAMLHAARQFLPYVGYGIYAATKP
jgi:ubiquinone/menaquinone biosynthesis C-methylase UbiE